MSRPGDDNRFRWFELDQPVVAKIAHAMQVEREPSIPVSYYDGRAHVYTKIGREHFTTDGAWFDYLAVRCEVPRLVVLFYTLADLRAWLYEERRIIV